MGHACMAVGAVHLRRGEHALGMPVLKQGVELTRAGDLPMGTRILTPILGMGLARLEMPNWRPFKRSGRHEPGGAVLDR